MEVSKLRNPAFPYLHDIIVATFNTTGFGQGLFSESELSAIIDRNQRVIFLTKTIALIELVLKETLDDKVFPAKIVAGQDTEQTNFFLQKLH